MKDRNIILALMIITLFSLSIITITIYLDFSMPSHLDSSVFDEMTTEEIISYYEEVYSNGPFTMLLLIPIISFASLIVGYLTFHILSKEVVTKEKTLSGNVDIILKLLEPSEKKAVEKIIDEGGKVQQAEITYLPNMGKVKTHRVLKKLEKRGIIIREKLGKINMIKLDPGIYEALKKRG